MPLAWTASTFRSRPLPVPLSVESHMALFPRAPEAVYAIAVHRIHFSIFLTLRIHPLPTSPEKECVEKGPITWCTVAGGLWFLSGRRS